MYIQRENIVAADRMNKPFCYQILIKCMYKRNRACVHVCVCVSELSASRGRPASILPAAKVHSQFVVLTCSSSVSCLASTVVEHENQSLMQRRNDVLSLG